jgi:hypothetical protein
VAINPQLERIFDAWYNYDHAFDEATKRLYGSQRDSMIRAALHAQQANFRIADFLRVYRDDYRKWMIDSKLSKERRRRF